MAFRKKRAFFRPKSNPSKLHGHDLFRMKEARKQSQKYVRASTPARMATGWGW